jgi:hypothetical protein
MRLSPGRLLVLLALASPAASCNGIGDLGPQPYACTLEVVDCPDGYVCDPQSNACEYLCAADGSCPDGLTCDSPFCVVPCQTTADCTAAFGDNAHACSTTLKFCVPAH